VSGSFWVLIGTVSVFELTKVGFVVASTHANPLRPQASWILAPDTKLLPVTVKVLGEVEPCTEFGLTLLTTGAGAAAVAVTVYVTKPELICPSGFRTRTRQVSVSFPVLIGTVSVFELTKVAFVVVSTHAYPFRPQATWILAPETKLLPVTVKVRGEVEPWTEFGFTAVTVGAGVAAVTVKFRVLDATGDVTCADQVAVTLVKLATTRIWLLLTKVTDFGKVPPFVRSLRVTVQPETKFDPLSVIVWLAFRPGTGLGLIEPITGAGVEVTRSIRVLATHPSTPELKFTCHQVWEVPLNEAVTGPLVVVPPAPKDCCPIEGPAADERTLTLLALVTTP